MSLSHKDQEQLEVSSSNKSTISKGKRAGATAEKKSKTPSQRAKKKETGTKSPSVRSPKPKRVTGNKKPKSDVSSTTSKQLQGKIDEPISKTALEKEIRERAFYIFKDQDANQASSGDELSNWLQAEKEIKAKYGLLKQVNP